MTLIKSISGIRGTIGGNVGENLTPIDIAKFTAAYGHWIAENNKNTQNITIVVGRDARLSGEMVNAIVTSTLTALGINVIELGLSTTPTVEIAVTEQSANGGIIITASHNPEQWNALKLLNENGEFLSQKDGDEIIRLAESDQYEFAAIENLGTVTKIDDYIQRHIETVAKLPLVDLEAIKNAHLKVVVDAVNSTGGIAIPNLLRRLGVTEIIELNCEPTGHFAHTPEPIPENLTQIAAKVKEVGADLGIVVDPDVDRLCFVCEDGTMFGEEYTLVAVADYILSKTPGNTVSNLSSTRALRDVTEAHGQRYEAAAVGEVNVVEKMKAVHAVIGGEGNGGVIYPAVHYGRDALVGVGLFLSHFIHSGKKATEFRNSFPQYVISKNKIELTPEINVDELLDKMVTKYKDEEVNTIDGVKIYIQKEWVHMRKSNTEPIIRIYAESYSKEAADQFAHRFVEELKELV